MRWSISTRQTRHCFCKKCGTGRAKGFCDKQRPTIQKKAGRNTAWYSSSSPPDTVYQPLPSCPCPHPLRCPGPRWRPGASQPIPASVCVSNSVPWVQRLFGAVVSQRKIANIIVKWSLYKRYENLMMTRAALCVHDAQTLLADTAVFKSDGTSLGHQPN